MRAVAGVILLAGLMPAMAGCFTTATIVAVKTGAVPEEHVELAKDTAADAAVTAAYATKDAAVAAAEATSAAAQEAADALGRLTD